MRYQRPTIRRYSEAFKYKVVSEIESGELTVAEARRVYDIRGGATVRGWLKRLGKHHLVAKVVRIEMKDEQDRVKALEKEKQRLESALAQAQLRIITLESTLEVTREHFGVTEGLKKNSAIRSSKEPLPK